MLIIVMHNDADYLDALCQLAKRRAINNVAIVKQRGIGAHLVGGDASFVFSQGKMIDTYDKAFVAVVKDADAARGFLDSLEQDNRLNVFNVEDKGFICAVPFHYIKKLKLELSFAKEEKETMKISELLRKENISLDLKAKTKEEAIREISSLLAKTDGMGDFDLFVNDIFERERLSTTGIGNRIAIPHARTDAVNDFVIAFGRSSGGIDFDSLDDQPAHFIVLMGTPREKGINSYLKFLARLTRLLNKPHFQDALLRAKTPQDIVEEFASMERKG